MGKRLQYTDFSNAAAIIERVDHRHGHAPQSHFDGALEASNIFFGVLERDSIKPEDPTNLESAVSFAIRQGPFRVQSSKKKNRLIVERI